MNTCGLAVRSLIKFSKISIKKVNSFVKKIFSPMMESRLGKTT